MDQGQDKSSVKIFSYIFVTDVKKDRDMERKWEYIISLKSSPKPL